VQGNKTIIYNKYKKVNGILFPNEIWIYGEIDQVDLNKIDWQFDTYRGLYKYEISFNTEINNAIFTTQTEEDLMSEKRKQYVSAYLPYFR